MKSKLFLLAISFVCLTVITSCDAKSDKPGTGSSKSMDNEQLTDFGNKYYAAWSSQKPESVAAFFASDGSLKISEDSTAVGREEIAKLVQRIMAANPDMKLALDSVVTKPNGFESHWTFTGTFFGPPSTGRDKMSGSELWHFDKDGLIKESIASF